MLRRYLVCQNTSHQSAARAALTRIIHTVMHRMEDMVADGADDVTFSGFVEHVAGPNHTVRYRSSLTSS